jgi:hypothetical protein
MVQHHWILCEKSTDELHLIHRSLVCTFGLAEILSFETSTFASTSSVGDLQLCLLFVLFVAKLSITDLTYIFGSRTWHSMFV